MKVKMEKDVFELINFPKHAYSCGKPNGAYDEDRLGLLNIQFNSILFVKYKLLQNENLFKCLYSTRPKKSKAYLAWAAKLDKLCKSDIVALWFNKSFK